MPLYRIDVRLYATAYIRASHAGEALDKAKALKDSALQVRGDHPAADWPDGPDVPISGARYDDPSLPAISLSPMMSVVGPEAHDYPELAEY